MVEYMIWLGLNPVILVAHSCLPCLALEEIVSMKTTNSWMVQIWHYFYDYVQWFKTFSIISVLSSQLIVLRILLVGRLLDDCFLNEIQFITSNSNISHCLLLLILLLLLLLLLLILFFLITLLIINAVFKKPHKMMSKMDSWHVVGSAFSSYPGKVATLICHHTTHVTPNLWY